MMGDSADVFAVIVASRLSGPVIWVGDRNAVDSLAPMALQEFIDPARMILTGCTTRKEILWASEQAMRTHGMSCVIVELHDGLTLRDSRRLQLAAGNSGCTGIILIAGRAHTSAAQTRWECVASPEEEDAKGREAGDREAGDRGARDRKTMGWEWRCTKNRQGELGVWRLQWLGGEDGRAGKARAVRLVSASAA
ncbi:MAG: hypothetical protein OXI81_10305 [Paracoccaceae bacterium]|nr:hypothetical protein [Paracoccaceae bacterium]MDE2912008.1 hypothetical protein [Paracoccaceae bacterium]